MKLPTKLLLPILCLLLSTPFLKAQAFTEVTAISDSLLGMELCTVSWGDYDNDGDLDILLMGGRGTEIYFKVYRNDGALFTDAHASIPKMLGDAAWGDYDNDGDLDIAAVGQYYSLPAYYSKIYRNDAGTFTNANAGLYPMVAGCIAWGDYDNDGELDLAISGEDQFGDRFLLIYRNDAGAFTNIQAGIPGTSSGFAGTDLDWADYDNDGDLDLLYGRHMYRNDDGVFNEQNVGFNSAINGGRNAFGDYDQDGDLDLITGGHTGNNIGWIYRNNGAGLFADITNVGLAGYYGNAVAWGDYDNDGDLDLLLSGDNGSGGKFSSVYRNDGGTFVDIAAGLPGVSLGSMAWGDYDNDGDLDFVLTGKGTGSTRISKVYRNNSAVTNSPPSAPTNLTAVSNGNSGLDFSWTAPTDDHTSSLGLSYRLWIGTSIGAYNVSSPDANPTTGARKVAARGNIQGTSWTLKNLINGQNYYACVSAIDAGFRGSACSNMTSVVAVSTRDGDPTQPCIVQAGPNPTQDRIHIAVQHPTASKKIQYALSTLDGQGLQGFSGTMTGELDLNLSQLAAGTYLLRLASSEFEKTESLRIIKQ